LDKEGIGMGDYMREIEFWHRIWTKNMPKCPGYGDREGKCGDVAIQGNEYCFDCLIEKLSKERGE